MLLRYPTDDVVSVLLITFVFGNWSHTRVHTLFHVLCNQLRQRWHWSEVCSSELVQTHRSEAGLCWTRGFVSCYCFSMHRWFSATKWCRSWLCRNLNFQGKVNMSSHSPKWAEYWHYCNVYSLWCLPVSCKLTMIHELGSSVIFKGLSNSQLSTLTLKFFCADVV